MARRAKKQRKPPARGQGFARSRYAGLIRPVTLRETACGQAQSGQYERARLRNAAVGVMGALERVARAGQAYLIEGGATEIQIDVVIGGVADPAPLGEGADPVGSRIGADQRIRLVERDAGVGVDRAPVRAEVVGLGAQRQERRAVGYGVCSGQVRAGVPQRGPALAAVRTLDNR